MKIKLNNGTTVKVYEPIVYLSNNALYAYSNSDYKIAIGEKKNGYYTYYIILNNDVVCGPTDWVEIEEFFEDLYKLFIE